MNCTLPDKTTDHEQTKKMRRHELFTWQKKLLLLLYILCFVTGYSQTATSKFIAFNNSKVSYMGRIGMSDSCANFYWSGSSTTIKVKGTHTLKAILADNLGNNYYYVVVDAQEPFKVKLDKGKKTYELVSNLDEKMHTIQLFKITNTDNRITSLYGFEIDEKGKVMQTNKLPKRKIEFFGNSITAGHGVDVPLDSSDSGAPQFFNNYKTYAATTARYFKAQYHCTAKSGIGIMVSWFNEIMPEIYDRLNPKDSNSKWIFKYQPDIVVVNLFQNDSWLVNQPANEQFKARFGSSKPSENFITNAYADFLKTLRSKYPAANIICCLGSMDATKEGSKWPGYIASAVALLKDKRIATHFFPYKKIGGHPKAEEQQLMAEDLIAFIRKNYWK